ncbi:MAG: CAP domain-containing protein [Actinomycetes bacterium]
MTITGADAPRTRPVVLVALALVLGLLGSLISAPQAARADESGVIFSLLNQARNGEGRSSLERMAALDAVALEWAKAMAASGTLSHNQSLSSQIPGGWSFIGENVARGYPSGSSMHEGWWNSSGHRANMLGDFTDVGIAFLSAGGSTWGVQVFARYGASLPPYSAPAPAQPAPAPAPAQPAPAPAPAQPAPAPAQPAPAAAASPDPQPSVIDPEPSRAPTLLPSPSATPSASPSASAESSAPPSAEPSASSAPGDGASTSSPWPIVAVVLLGLLVGAAVAAALLVRRRRAQT